MLIMFITVIYNIITHCNIIYNNNVININNIKIYNINVINTKTQLYCATYIYIYLFTYIPVPIAHWIKDPLQRMSEHNHRYNYLNFSVFQ